METELKDTVADVCAAAEKLDRRQQGHAKHRDDARDIEYWLNNFASGTHDARRYELVDKDGLKHEDYATAGAVLMGLEVGRLASPGAAACVDRFLKESFDLYTPFMDALAAGKFEDAAEKKREAGLALLAGFRKGFDDARRRTEASQP